LHKIFEKEVRMSVLLISYDAWIDPNPDPVRQLMSQYRHIQLSESTYAIETNEQTRTIFNKIISLFEVDIHLLVVTLIKPFACLPKGQVSKWLSKRLPED
jgi:hypothetical protein